MLNDILTVLRTELADHSRDRRSLFAAFAYALFGPVVMLVALNFAVKEVRREAPVAVAVYGHAEAPNFVAELERRGFVVSRRDDAAPIPDLAGVDAALRIPDGFAAKWKEGRTAEVTLYRDESRSESLRAARQVAVAIRAYGADVAQARLMARGVAADTVAPVSIVDANVAVSKAGTLQIANMLLYFFLMAPLFTGMSMAIDSTAGERERRSLRPLLAQPVSPVALILGKWANATLFCILGTGLTVILGLTLLRFAPLEQLGVTMQLGPRSQMLMWLSLVPLCLAVTACQVLVALLAKSFKEAQTYIQLMSFAPVVILVFTSFGDRQAQGLQKMLPIVGHSDLLRPLVSEGLLNPVQALVVSAVTLVAAVAALFEAQRRLRDERILTTA